LSGGYKLKEGLNHEKVKERTTVDQISTEVSWVTGCQVTGYVVG